MKTEIVIWEIDRASRAGTKLDLAKRVETEEMLEAVLVANPNILMRGLTLVGRQVPVETGVVGGSARLEIAEELLECSIVITADIGAHRHVDRGDVAAFKQRLLGGGELKQAHEVHLGGIAMAESVVDPADPLQKVRIVAGEADQAEGVLQERLADRVHEGSEFVGISPVVLVGDDERAVGRQTAMQLDDSRAIGVSEVVGLEHDVVPLGDDGTTGTFEKRVVVRSENIGPREIEQGFVEW